MGILDRVAGVAPTRTRRGQFQSLARPVETASDWNGNGRYLERRRWCLVRSGQPIKNQSRLVKEGASGAVCLLTVGRRWMADGEAASLDVRTYLHGDYAQHYCRYSLGPLQEQLTQSCTHSHRHRGNSKNSTPRSHQSQSPIYTTVAREHHHLHDAPVRTSVRSHHHLGMSFLLHAGPSIYRAPGYPDLSAVLPPCVASLAEREESVEAFCLFFVDFFLHRRHSCWRPALSRPMAS